MEKKRCSCCNHLRPVTAFNKKASSPDGLQSYCKKCQHDWRMASKEQGPCPEPIIVNPEDELAKTPGFDPMEYTGAPHPRHLFPGAQGLKTSELVGELKERGYKGAIFNPTSRKYINL